MRKPKIIGGYQNTKLNKEDFAITPYLFGIFVKLTNISVYGIGLCWGYYSIYIGLGFGIPNEYQGFKILKYKKK